MTDTLVVGKTHIHIPLIDDTTNLSLLAQLLTEYRRVTKTYHPPEGAFQHLVLLRLELEYEGIMDDRSHDRVSASGKTVFTAWTDQEICIADEFYMRYVNDICNGLLDICAERITHRQRKERRFKARLEDLIISRMMAVLNDALDNFEYSLDEEVREVMST